MAQLGRAQSLDSAGLETYFDSVRQFQFEYSQSLPILTRAVSKSQASNNKRLLGRALKERGKLFYFHAMLDSCEAQWKEALENFEAANSRKEQAATLNNLGALYERKGDYNRGLDHHRRSLEIKSKLGDAMGVGTSYNNIGNIYQMLNEYPEAISYYVISDSIHKAIDNPKGVALVQGNLSSIYQFLNKWDQALVHAHKARYMFESMNDAMNLGKSLKGICTLHNTMENYDSAQYYINESAKIYASLNNDAGYYDCLVILAAIFESQNMLDSMEHYAKIIQQLPDNVALLDDTRSRANVQLGVIAMSRKDYDNARRYYEVALRYNGHDNAQFKRAIHQSLCEIYQLFEEYELASKHCKRYVKLRDSIAELEYESQALRQIALLEFMEEDKRDDLAREEQNRMKEELIKRKQVESLGAWIGAILLLVLTGIGFRNVQLQIRSNKEISNQHDIISKQKNEVESKNRQIQEALSLGQEIQDNILPDTKTMASSLGEHFALYIPKDVVAGDFYWMHQRGETIFLAAADCTGHGVPGAMVSLICSNALTKAVTEQHLTEPGKILDRARDIVVSEFSKGENVKDGMDISLVVYTKSSGKLLFAGANNPVYLRREEFMEVKGDKEPIGYFENATSFATHELDLREGDQFYLFTDGYADQFGGPKGKKLKYRPFREYLESIAHLSMPEQKQKLATFFDSWRGPNEQVDDVCILSVKV